MERLTREDVAFSDAKLGLHALDHRLPSPSTWAETRWDRDAASDPGDSRGALSSSDDEYDSSELLECDGDHHSWLGVNGDFGFPSRTASHGHQTAGWDTEESETLETSSEVASEGGLSTPSVAHSRSPRSSIGSDLGEAFQVGVSIPLNGPTASHATTTTTSTAHASRSSAVRSNLSKKDHSHLPPTLPTASSSRKPNKAKPKPKAAKATWKGGTATPASVTSTGTPPLPKKMAARSSSPSSNRARSQNIRVVCRFRPEIESDRLCSAKFSTKSDMESSDTVVALSSPRLLAGNSRAKLLPSGTSSLPQSPLSLSRRGSVPQNKAYTTATRAKRQTTLSSTIATFEDQKTVTVARASSVGKHVQGKAYTPKVFTFDRVFSTESGQEEVYQDTAKPVIEDLLDGYNGTVFAYGQTSSGKTYTMFGEAGVREGIIPRVAKHIFARISASDAAEVTIRASFLEIYQDSLVDLLVPQQLSRDDNANSSVLRVRECPIRGVWVDGLTEEFVTCEDDILDLLVIGESSRRTATTAMNETSSRSHTIFKLCVTQKLTDGSSKVGVLNLVDLAGSENVNKSKAQGQTLQEARKINASLSALGGCIRALAQRQPYIPYRDSKLTFILRESLGGNMKTTLICTCSPHESNLDETVSTLKFARRAKRIQNTVTRNHVRSAQDLEALVSKLREEIIHLKATNEALSHKNRKSVKSYVLEGDPVAIAESQLMLEKDRDAKAMENEDLRQSLSQMMEQNKILLERNMYLESLHDQAQEQRATANSNGAPPTTDGGRGCDVSAVGTHAYDEPMEWLSHEPLIAMADVRMSFSGADIATRSGARRDSTRETLDFVTASNLLHRPRIARPVSRGSVLRRYRGDSLDGDGVRTRAFSEPPPPSQLDPTMSGSGGGLRMSPLRESERRESVESRGSILSSYGSDVTATMSSGTHSNNDNDVGALASTPKATEDVVVDSPHLEAGNSKTDYRVRVKREDSDEKRGELDGDLQDTVKEIHALITHAFSRVSSSSSASASRDRDGCVGDTQNESTKIVDKQLNKETTTATSSASGDLSQEEVSTSSPRSSKRGKLWGIIPSPSSSPTLQRMFFNRRTSKDSSTSDGFS